MYESYLTGKKVKTRIRGAVSDWFYDLKETHGGDKAVLIVLFPLSTAIRLEYHRHYFKRLDT